MLSQVGAASGGTAPAPALAAAQLRPASLPGWLAMRVRAESDHLVLDEALPTVKVAGVTPGQNRVGTLAPPACPRTPSPSTSSTTSAA